MKSTFAADLAEMMAAWNKIEAAAKAQFPKASAQERYEIALNAMKHAMGMTGKANR